MARLLITIVDSSACHLTWNLGWEHHCEFQLGSTFLQILYGRWTNTVLEQVQFLSVTLLVGRRSQNTTLNEEKELRAQISALTEHRGPPARTQPHQDLTQVFVPPLRKGDVLLVGGFVQFRRASDGAELEKSFSEKVMVLLSHRVSRIAYF